MVCRFSHDSQIFQQHNWSLMEWVNHVCLGQECGEVGQEPAGREDSHAAPAAAAATSSTTRLPLLFVTLVHTQMDPCSRWAVATGT